MSQRSVVAVVIAALLAGLVVGYLYWGQRSARLADELARATADLAGERVRGQERQRELTARLQDVEGRLKQLQEDLEAERQRRTRLEALLSRGRK